MKKNSEPVSPSYGTYRVDVADGDIIEIQASFPDEDYSVKFNLSEKAAGFITKVQVNGTEVENYMDDIFTVKAGSQVDVEGNTNDYTLESFKVNGSSVDFYGSYSFMVTGPTTVDIVARKLGNLSAILDIDDASHVEVYKGYSYYGNNVEVVTGKNTIEVPESAPIIAVKAKDGYALVSVSDGTTDYVDRDGNSEVNVKVTDGMMVTVKTTELVRDKTVMIYVDDAERPSKIFLKRKDYTMIDLATGYTSVAYYAGDLPLTAAFYGVTSMCLYKNDELVSPDYDGSTTYTLTPEDMDVLKVFFTKTPSNVMTNIKVTGNAEELVVLKDRIVPVTDFSQSIMALEDTEISFRASGASKIKSLKYGMNAVEPQEDGTYRVVLTVDSDINVEVGVASVIENVMPTDEEANNVYTMDGILVMKNASRSQIDGLAKGMYIINGKKLIR